MTFNIGDEVVIKPNYKIPEFIMRGGGNRGAGIVTELSPDGSIIYVENPDSKEQGKCMSDWFELVDPVDKQKALCKDMYGDNTITIPKGYEVKMGDIMWSKPDKDEILDEFAETIEEIGLPDYEELAEQSTKRLTNKEWCDTLDILISNLGDIK